ncbi:hypothetical protein DV738_g2492, partial [Chaetothyriales sp. CBS 135597]
MTLSLFASSAWAFYPYLTKNSPTTDAHNKRFVPTILSSETTDGAGGITLDIKKIRPAKRDNDFSVLLSNTPSADNAIAINQDGSDYSYFATLKFGSKGQDMYMLIDTGSANTWIMGSSCTSTACQTHNTFGSSDSTSLTTTTQTWKIAYGTGQVAGILATDKVTFGDYDINLTFGLATQTSNDFNNYPFDGILGLGPTSSNQLDSPTLMQALDDQTSLRNNVLGVHLSRASDGDKDGELTIGGVDDSKFEGELNYLSTVKTDSWEISVDDAIVDGKECGLTGKTAIVDTGTSYVLMPPNDAQTLHALIPGSVQDDESYTIPCDTTTELQVSLNGVKYSISPKDYVGKSSGDACSSNIIGHQAFGANEWILGDVFLKNVYAVFDFDKNRIGREANDLKFNYPVLTIYRLRNYGGHFRRKLFLSKSDVTSLESSNGSSEPSSVATASNSGASGTSDAAMAHVPLAMVLPVAFADGAPLLRPSLDAVDDDGSDDALEPSPSTSLDLAVEPRHLRPGIKRHSSLSQPRPDGTPRTPNRVRFDLADTTLGRQSEEQWLDDEDYIHHHPSSQNAPLLTDITPPSASPFLSDAFQPEDHLPNVRPKSGLASAVMNMANSIIGAGIIGQPYAFKQAGMLTGILLLIVLTITVDWTIRLIVINSKLSGTDSFQGTMQHCFGRSGLIAISVAQWAFAFGGMVAFCIVVGDTVPHVLEAVIPNLRNMPFLWLLSDRQAIIIIFTLGISWPLSLYRDIAKLAKASTLALISMLVILVTVVTQGPRVDAELKGGIKSSLFINSGVFQAIGVISFAFVCHHNSLLIYGSLEKPTIDRFTTVTHYSTFASLVACLVMALTGFLTFGDKTKGNVLNNFPSQGFIMVQIARLCFGLNMLTTLPLECFVCREVMNNFWFPEEPYQPNRHLIFTSALVVSAMGISLITCDLGAVFELIGATSACALAYILPPLCYIKLSVRGWKTIPAVACIVFGSAVLVISLFMAVGNMMKVHL